jgi:chromate reductase, NAD(P)H dehydrogenase (quinone)
MSSPKILVIPGSLRSASYNIRLAAVATKELTIAEADVTRISLADYPLPLYDADLVAKEGPPANAVQLKKLLAAHRGIFIASPEYNASITPLLKNAIDWISVVRDPGEVQLAVFQNRAFAIGGASPGRSGGLNSLLTLRQVLSIGCRAFVVPEQVAIPNAEQAFNERDELVDARAAGQLKTVVKKLIDYARMFGG